MRARRFLLTTVLIIPLIITGCSTLEDADDETSGMSVAELYQASKALLKDKEYGSAIEYYEKLESRFPYGVYAESARLEVAYAYYKDGQPETAITAANRFIKLHPNHPNVDYAYYLRGLASFDNSQSFFDRLFDQDPSERDPQAVRRAFQYFSDLVKRYPKSRYIPDTIKRMKLLRENLAKYELHVANFYFRKGAFLAAANRAKYVIENYKGAQVTPDALALMTGSYRKLGMNDLAKDTYRVLELNYPRHEKTLSLKQKTAE